MLLAELALLLIYLNSLSTIISLFSLEQMHLRSCPFNSRKQNVITAKMLRQLTFISLLSCFPSLFQNCTKNAHTFLRDTAVFGKILHKSGELSTIAFSTNVCVEQRGCIRDRSSWFIGPVWNGIWVTRSRGGRGMEIESRNACPKSGACRSSLRNTRKPRWVRERALLPGRPLIDRIL